MIMHKDKFGDLFEFLPKSGLKAEEGKDDGRYPFFTSSTLLSKWTDSASYNVEALIFGTGGGASVHHARGDFSTSNDCLVAKAKNPNSVISRYCFHYLAANINLLETGFRGAGLKHISKDYIEAIEIPLPSLTEQQRIAEILDRADALRTKRRAAIAQLDTFTQAIFIDLFGDHDNILLKWPSKKLGDILDFITSGSRGWAKYYVIIP